MSTQPQTQIRSEPTDVEGILEQLLGDHHEQLLGYAARRVRGDHDGAEDVLQTACLAFLRWFRPQGSGEHLWAAARGYLYASIETAASKRQRALARKPLAGGFETDLDLFSSCEQTPDAILAEREEVEGLLASVAALPARQRDVVLLQAAGYRTAEVCERLRISERMRRKAIGAAKRTLREAL